MLKLGAFRTSSKKNEKRFPLHPEHFSQIDNDLKQYIYLEQGYGKGYGLSDKQLEREFAGVLARDELFEKTDIWTLPKPEEADHQHFQPNKVLWGWSHLVQGPKITQALVDARMTAITWEGMFGGADEAHVFHRNNELAGYAAVKHMLMLSGVSGAYGRSLKAAVLGFGASGRGAVHGLQSEGINNIDVFTQRPPHLVYAPIPGVRHGRTFVHPKEVRFSIGGTEDSSINTLKQYDLVVNCVLQDPLNPLMYFWNDALNQINKNLIIVDVSCDEGMGFEFATPTSFDNPIIEIDKTPIKYYAVDHTPCLYWDAASYQISKAILPYLRTMIEGTWKSQSTLKNAIEIESGDILNTAILDFQKRV